MLQMLESYVNILVVTSIITSILMSLVPKGATKAIIGVVAGVVMIIVLLKPLGSLKNLDLHLPQSDRRTKAVEENLAYSKLLKELIVDKTSAYILAKAQALSIECQVILSVSDDEVPLPKTVIIRGEHAPKKDAQDNLRSFLEFEIGIPKENQRFVWRNE